MDQSGDLSQRADRGCTIRAYRLPGASVYRIDLDIPNDHTQLQGHETVHYTNQETAPLNEIYFRLFPNAAGGKATIANVKSTGRL
jgi:hypothetical protein